MWVFGGGVYECWWLGSLCAWVKSTCHVRVGQPTQFVLVRARHVRMHANAHTSCMCTQVCVCTGVNTAAPCAGRCEPQARARASACHADPRESESSCKAGPPAPHEHAWPCGDVLKKSVCGGVDAAAGGRAVGSEELARWAYRDLGLSMGQRSGPMQVRIPASLPLYETSGTAAARVLTL
jgi:hypothetical protein